MLLFAFLAIPAVSVFFCDFKNSPRFLPITELVFLHIAGMLFACLYCLIDVFFLTPPILFHYSFLARFINPFFYEMLLPLVITGTVFAFFVKEPLEYLCTSFPFFLAGFYIILVPAKLLAYGSEYTFFIAFAKPLLFCSVLYTLPFFFQILYRRIAEKNVRQIALLILCGLLLLSFPALTEAVWFMKISLPFWLLPFCAAALSPYLLSRFFNTER